MMILGSILLVPYCNGQWVSWFIMWMHTQNVSNTFIKKRRMLQQENASPSHYKTLRNLKLYARSLQEGNSTMAKIS